MKAWSIMLTLLVVAAGMAGCGGASKSEVEDLSAAVTRLERQLADQKAASTKAVDALTARVEETTQQAELAQLTQQVEEVLVTLRQVQSVTKSLGDVGVLLKNVGQAAQMAERVESLSKTLSIFDTRIGELDGGQAAIRKHFADGDILDRLEVLRTGQDQLDQKTRDNKSQMSELVQSVDKINNLLKLLNR